MPAGIEWEGARMGRCSTVTKRIGIGCGGLLVAASIAVAALLVWTPWAPTIEVVDPGSTGRRVDEAGLLGNYYPASDGRGPGVLVIGGSEGGLGAAADALARSLSDEGFSALALSYWGGPDQPPRMELLPLETFDTALAWLGRQPDVNPGGVAVLGASKGGEAALLVASRRADVAATVAYAPSNVAWQGLDLAQVWRMPTIGSTWSVDGVEVPYLPYASMLPGGQPGELYRASLAELAHHPEAVIPVERSRGPLLLVCGEDDTMWPSCEMARAASKRVVDRGGVATVLAYPQAGHLIGGPPLPPGHPSYADLAAFGGTPEGNQAARADSWPKVVAFLTDNLARP